MALTETETNPLTNVNRGKRMGAKLRKLHPELGGPAANGSGAGGGHTSVFVPLDSIEPWAGNPRKTFPAEDLRDLASSLTAHGMIQPLLVRLSLKGSKLYELADGERRYRAAKLAGLSEVPVIIRELTEDQMLVIALTTREQSRDLQVLERAEALRRAVEEHGIGLDVLAAQIGRSPSTLRGILLLPRLPAIALAALESGHLSASTAQLIARVPGEQSRLRAAWAVLSNRSWNPDERTAKNQVAAGDAPMSYREAKRHVEEHCMVELKTAPFSRKSLDLVPAAGSCDACPKRAGNDPETFAGIRADVCTDPDCYRVKVEAHAAKLKAEASAAGKKVLSDEEAKGLFPGGVTLRYDAPYVELGATCHEDKKHRTYGKLVGKTLADQVVLAQDGEGNLHPLLPKSAVAKALNDLGIKGNHTSNSGGSSSWKRDQAKHRAKTEIGKRAAAAACELAAKAVQTAAGSIVGMPFSRLPIFLAVARSVAAAAGYEACRLVASRRGQKGEEPIRRVIASLSTLPEVLALIAELGAAREAAGWGHPYFGQDQDKTTKAYWQTFGVDKAALLKQAAAAAKAKASAKGKPRLKVAETE